MVKKFLVNGTQYNSQKELCEAFGVNKDNFSSRLKVGWTTEEALNLVKRGRVKKNPTPRKVVFEGKIYKSYAELCREKNVNQSTFNRRMHKGYSIAECLYGKDASFTYKGVKYNSLNALCKATNMGWETVNHRLKLGYTVEQAIEWDECHNSIYKVYYNGEYYKSERNLCEKMGVPYITFSQRKNKGLSLEECLFGGQRKSDNPEKYSYKGKFYPSLYAICKEYNLKYNTLLARIKTGLTLEDAIEGNLNGRTKKNVTYNGVSYTTQKEMCEALGINLVTFKDRKKKGWTLEECIHGRVKLS